MKNLYIGYLDQNGDNVGMILPEDSGFQEAKDLLSNNITNQVFLKSEGSRIKWFMHKVGSSFTLKGSLK